MAKSISKEEQRIAVHATISPKAHELIQELCLRHGITQGRVIDFICQLYREDRIPKAILELEKPVTVTPVKTSSLFG